MNVVPFYPLRVLPAEDYFNADLIYTFGDKVSTDKVRYFKTPLQLFKALPVYDEVNCHGMSRNMVMLYFLLSDDHRYRTITPHASFGKYPPWGYPVDVSWLLRKLIRKFDVVYASNRYEFNYYMSHGIKQVEYRKLTIYPGFELFRKHLGTGVLCMGGDRKVKNVKTIIRACRIARKKLTVIDNVEPGSKEYFNAFIHNDIFVNSSYMEGSPLGVGEAYASGMKLCLSDIPTLRSEYAGEALFHDPDDYEQLAKNIRSCTGV